MDTQSLILKIILKKSYIFKKLVHKTVEANKKTFYNKTQ